MMVDSGNSWIETLCATEGLPASYPGLVHTYLTPLAARIRNLHSRERRSQVIGINGAQGSGKSTLTLFLRELLTRESSLNVVSLSIDDLYLTRTERAFLAAALHPLFATRGVPGTHDVKLGMAILEQLTDPAGRGSLHLPTFDKAIDDRRPPEDWLSVRLPVDIVLFEGWCVAARAQQPHDLREPVNELEASEDPQGIWRSAVNRRLETDYKLLFAMIDKLVMLRIPSFDKVFEWRGLQEDKLRRRRAEERDAGIDISELQRFIMHYERLTRHMMVELPDHADTIIDVNEHHEFVQVVHPGWQAINR